MAGQGGGGKFHVNKYDYGLLKERCAITLRFNGVGGAALFRAALRKAFQNTAHEKGGEVYYGVEERRGTGAGVQVTEE